MRQIGQLNDPTQARIFSDFLVANGVRNMVERDGNSSWSMWIHDEDRIAAAQRWFEEFRANPAAPEFRDATIGATKAREAEARDLEEYRARIRTRKSVFPKMGGYRVGVLTYGLILICIIVAVYSKMGSNHDFLNHLFITDPTGRSGKTLPEVFAGEVWRLFTPMFIHFGPLHLIFNMMWLFQLGSMIEGRQGAGRLAALVFGIELLCNLAQHFIAHGIIFGGMSGVIYGLAGYIWIRGKFDHSSGLFLDPQSVTILLVWLVICYSGMIGANIANTSHLVGLLTGMAWGWLSANFKSRPKE